MSWQPDNNSDSNFRPPWMDVPAESDSAQSTAQSNVPGSSDEPSEVPQRGESTAEQQSTPPSPGQEPYLPPPFPQAQASQDMPQTPINQGQPVTQGPSRPLPPSSSPFAKIIPFLGVGIIILLIIFVVRTILTKKNGISQEGKKGSGKEIVLTYWGLWEPEQVMAPIIAEYKKEHPKVTINYVFQSHKDYRERLQSALAAGKGPDIMRLHLTWLPMFKNQLAAVPEGLVDWGNYFPVVSLLREEGKFYALPLEFDALALFYNSDIFAAASQTPPVDWEQLRKTALSLTVRGEDGRIQTAGVALGTTNNVDHWSDIVGLMMLQNGANLAQPTGKLAEDTLKFYTIFVRSDKVWDETLPSSVHAFATGKVAMIFAPSWRVFEVKEISPKLAFRTAPVPQLPGTQLSWATFWTEAVSKASPAQEAAWEFLKYLSNEETLKKIYTYQSQIRLFGEPYPLKSLSGQLEADPVIGAFVAQGPYAQSWYLCSATHDNGINERMIKYFEDAVNGVLQGKDASKACQQAAAGVNQVLSQYQIFPKTTP